MGRSARRLQRIDARIAARVPIRIVAMPSSPCEARVKGGTPSANPYRMSNNRDLAECGTHKPLLSGRNTNRRCVERGGHRYFPSRPRNRAVPDREYYRHPHIGPNTIRIRCRSYRKDRSRSAVSILPDAFYRRLLRLPGLHRKYIRTTHSV